MVGAKNILLEGLILIIGIKGCEPGGKEWPISLRFKFNGGSISSFKASSNFVFFIVLSNVRATFVDLAVLFKVDAANFLTLP